MGRFGGQSRALIAAAAMCPVVACAVVLSAQSTFKVNVRLVRLLVTVKDQKDQLVGSLESKDFKVYDSGVEQEVAVFERQTALPLSVSLLLDTSGSTGKDLRYEVTSIQKFLKALLSGGNSRDAASLYEFNYDVALLSSFTRRQARLDDALRLLRPGGGTSLYDAIFLSSGNMEGREGRHAIVAVTDGGDTTSRKKYQDAL